MCPPIQPRDVELRAAALLNSVSRLSKLTERTCNVSWPSAILEDMNMHYQVTRAASFRLYNWFYYTEFVITETQSDCPPL